MKLIAFLLLLSTVHCGYGLIVPVRSRYRVGTAVYSSIIKEEPPTASPRADHWSEGLKFSCTGCGRCCLNEGTVWMDVHEVVDLIDTLKLPVNDVFDVYVKTIMGDWVEINSKNFTITQHDVEKQVEGCIFLSNQDQKSCTIYENRPVQCRTYPYWPNLMSSQDNWLKESVVPDNIQGKHWSMLEGGCEGIEGGEKEKVSPLTIHRNLELYKSYTQNFPFIIGSKDKENMMSKIDIIQRIRKATSEWIRTFVIGYSLCPFAEKAFSTGRVRSRVFFPKLVRGERGSAARVGEMEKENKEGKGRGKGFKGVLKAKTEKREREKREREKREKEAREEREREYGEMIQFIKEEVFYLLAHNNEEVETSLLVFPFSFPNFQEFHYFSLYVEDEVLPFLLREAHPLAPAEGEEREGELQLASFHPLFTYQGGEEGAISYEKRAPFPTLNLLRSATIRDYAGGVEGGRRIGERNKEKLEGVGEQTLAEQMTDILTKIL